MDNLDRVAKQLGISILIMGQDQLLGLVAHKIDDLEDNIEKLKIQLEEKDKVIKRLLEKNEGES